MDDRQRPCVLPDGLPTQAVLVGQAGGPVDEKGLTMLFSLIVVAVVAAGITLGVFLDEI